MLSSLVFPLSLVFCFCSQNRQYGEKRIKVGGGAEGGWWAAGRLKKRPESLF